MVQQVKEEALLEKEGRIIHLPPNFLPQVNPRVKVCDGLATTIRAQTRILDLTGLGSQADRRAAGNKVTMEESARQAFDTDRPQTDAERRCGSNLM